MYHTVSGSGDIVGYVDKNVFTVTLPTTSDVNFALDPQELMKAVDTTGAFTVDGTAANVGYGAKVLFANADTAGTGYATQSKDIPVVNKSTFDVDVTVNAKVTGLNGDGYDIKLVDPNAEGYTNMGTDTAIALLLTTADNTIKGDGTGEGSDSTDATNTKYLKSGDEGVTIKKTVLAINNPDTVYKVTEPTTGNYQYALDSTSAAAATFNEAVFYLSGQVNTDAKADWSKFNDAQTKNLKVDITYTVDKHVDGPQVTLTAGGLVTITNLTSAQNFTGYSDYTFKNIDTSVDTVADPTNATWNGTNWTAENGGSGTMQLGAAWNVWNGAQVKVTVKLTGGTTIESNTVTLAVQ